MLQMQKHTRNDCSAFGDVAMTLWMYISVTTFFKWTFFERSARKHLRLKKNNWTVTGTDLSISIAKMSIRWAFVIRGRWTSVSIVSPWIRVCVLVRAREWVNKSGYRLFIPLSFSVYRFSYSKKNIQLKIVCYRRSLVALFGGKFFACRVFVWRLLVPASFGRAGSYGSR